MSQYKGFELKRTTTGGKAGRGNNKTASIRVYGELPDGTTVCRYVRYDVEDAGERFNAMDRAKALVNRLLKK